MAEKIDYFDYKRLARKVKVPNSILKRIQREVKKEFPSDKMLYELHVLRAVRSKYWQTKKEKQKRDGCRKGRLKKPLVQLTQKIIELAARTYQPLTLRGSKETHESGYFGDLID